MNLDLTQLFPDLEALTPDGRWNALQSWLSENPEYGERVEKWSKQSVDEVFCEIQILVLKKKGAIAAIALTIPAVSAKIKSTITILQACYRERAAYDNQPTEKEIKNVRTRRIQKRNGSARNAKNS